MSFAVFRSSYFACIICCATCAVAQEFRVPAFTAYILPDADAARISEQRGVTRWTDPEQSVNWYGKFTQKGSLVASVELRLPTDAVSQLKMTINGQSREAFVTGKGQDNVVLVKFGEFKIAEAKNHRIALESMNEQGKPFGDRTVPPVAR